MNSVLINGSYTTAEAEQLLSGLFKVKTEFHMARINTGESSEEDIKHSEKRIMELESELRRVINTLKAGSYERVVMNARLVLEFCPEYEHV